jgi:dihydroneopterin aldolase
VKLENFSYNAAMKALELLERQHHYKIPETVKKEIAEAVVKEIDSLIEP